MTGPIGRGIVAAVVVTVLCSAVVAATSGPLAGGTPAVETASPPPTDAATEVRNCRTISEPGTYVLTRDVKDGGNGENFTHISGACIRIESSDVTFDGNGRTVDGFGVSDTTAIRAGGDGRVSDVTVRNVRVTEWNRGVYFANVTNGVVRDANVSGNSFGVFVEDSTGIGVRNVSAERYFVGVYLRDAEATVTDSSFTADRSNAVVRERTAG